MIGKVIVLVDPGPHCYNGWPGTETDPACNYTGGHFCCLPAYHEGECRCSCTRSTAEHHRLPDGKHCCAR